MRHVLAIARKELRGYFSSAVALIFLATFLGIVVFTFFWVEKFFSRNVADLRPLFDWLPLLLIFLVSALSMRLWSEEQKIGTIEILLTLPVPHWKLVAGKFLAGMALIALALALTLGLPITVEMMGNLDWGPVIGGYLAALLLAGAYLSIGLCVSAATSEQIVALILTAAVCALFYLPGAEAVSNFFGGEAAEVLRRISTRGRFESIARGVLDLRDLAYYASIIVLFLTVNVVLLRSKSWSRGERTRRQRFNQLVGVGLVAANALALNLWMAPVAAARVDMTQDGAYSLSDVTQKIVGSLDQPLTIRAYFSEKTHPLLAPLVPQVRDLLSEYKAIGGSKIKVEVVDPASSEEVEKEAQERYGIKSFPFRFADRRERSVVNAYFHVLVSYGDQFEVLTFEDLIEVRQTDIGDIDVKLRNLEYDITRTIKKVAYEFQSLDALFASLPGKVELTAYITPKTLPENLKDVPDKLKKVTDELSAEAGGSFSFTTVEPDSRATQQALYQRYGFEPFQASLLSNQVFYLHFVLKIGDKEMPIPAPREMTDAALKEAFVEGLKRAAPGFVKTVGLWTPPAEQPQQQQMPGQPPPRGQPPQSFNNLREQLSQNYEVVTPDLASGSIDDSVEVLVLAGPADLDDKAKRAVDQFVMRGGALIVLDGRYRLNLEARQLEVLPVKSGLEDLLETWGIKVEPKLVLDSRNDSFPMPVERDLGGLVVRDVKQLAYPFFLHVPRDAMSDGVITGNLAAAVWHYASPVTAKPDQPSPAVDKKDADAEPPPPRKVEVLMKSSDDSWLQAAPEVQPDFRLHPRAGFGKPSKVPDGEKGPHGLAIAVTGSFPSGVAGGDKKQDAPKEGEPPAPAPEERLLKRSPPDTRVVVAGSSSFVTDELFELSRQAGADYVVNNFELVQNMVDWAVADTDLLAIRSRGVHTRLLEVTEDSRGKWEWTNYGIMVVALAAVIGLTLMRRNQTPMELDPPRSVKAEEVES
ncbi:MAG TPA: Gldg family protein [Kofleriaceae bacterium]|nr:Gldg family protein [Kofleriaceae bacterium]